MKEKKIIFILTSLTLIFLISLVFYIYQNDKSEKLRIKQENELQDVYLEIDSISNLLNDKILTISQLGGEIDSLLILKENIETEKREFRTRAYSQINRLQGKVEGYRELLIAQDEEIERLKKLNEQLYEENKEQKVEINNLNSTISNINESNQILEEKIKVAARLELKNIEIIGVFRNGSTKLKSFKNRSLSKIRIDFTLAENDLAKIEVLDIYLRVEKPSGDVFFDISNGSGSFTFENRELFYTIKEEILVDRFEKKLSLEYEKNEDFNKGVHKVVLYTRNYIIGSSEFLVK